METKNREKLLLIGTGAAIALWLLNLLVISPLIDSWHSRSAEIDKLKTEIAEGNRLIQRKATIQDRWDYMRGNALNSNPTVAERQLFTAFDRWVKSGGVAQGSFRAQLQDNDTNYLTVDSHSDVSGSIRNVSDFLKAMSKDPLADKLDSFVLTAKDDNGKQLTLDLNLSGLVLTDSVPTLSLGAADAVPRGRDNISETNADLDPFQLITRNNIFDQSRFPRSSDTVPVARRTPKVDILTFCGPGIDYGVGAAIFEGAGVRTGHDYKVGESIGDLKITQITFTDVTMTNAGGNTYHLPVGTSLRREDNGPWRLYAYVAVMPALETSSTTSDSPGSGSGSKLDEILAKLRKQREEAK